MVELLKSSFSSASKPEGPDNNSTVFENGQALELGCGSKPFCATLLTDAPVLGLSQLYLCDSEHATMSHPRLGIRTDLMEAKRHWPEEGGRFYRHLEPDQVHPEEEGESFKGESFKAPKSKQLIVESGFLDSLIGCPLSFRHVLSGVRYLLADTGRFVSVSQTTQEAMASLIEDSGLKICGSMTTANVKHANYDHVEFETVHLHVLQKAEAEAHTSDGGSTPANKRAKHQA